MNEFFHTSAEIAQAVRRLLKPGEPSPVVLCIGSDRVILDSLGPLTGRLLTTAYPLPVFVYGTLGCPVHALNLSAAIRHIARRHPNAPVIAVDASLGAPSDVGRISVIDGGVRAGAAFCKNLPRAGNIGITATVAPLRARRSGNVRLAFVARLAETVAQALYLALGKTDAASGEAKSPPRAVNI